MVKPPLRTKSVGTKVTQAEYAQLERTAQAAGKTLGECCREVLLAGVDGHLLKDQLSDGAEAQALMAELVALRAILLNVLFKQTNGERLTPDEMQRLIDRADSDKVRKARERLEQASDSKQG
jgi:hypothetical protein